MMRGFVQSLGRRFKRDERGNIATLTAAALLMVVGATALSVDVSKVTNTESRLSDASDALSLRLTQSGETNPAEMTRVARNFLTETYPGTSGDNIEIISMVWDGDAVTVTLSDISNTAYENPLEY